MSYKSVICVQIASAVAIENLLAKGAFITKLDFTAREYLFTSASAQSGRSRIYSQPFFLYLLRLFLIRIDF